MKKLADNSLLKRFIRHEITPIFGVLVVFFVVVGLMAPNFVSYNNIMSVFMNLAITGMVALGMGLVMISGGIDLSVGWMMSAVGSAVAYMMVYMHVEPIVAAFIGVALSMAMGTFMGFLISRTKIEPFIISLGFMSAYQGITYIITGAREIRLEPGMFEFLGKTRIFEIFLPIYIFVFMTLLLWLILKYTRYGRRVYAVGGNANAAFLAGINVKNFKMGIYTINGFIISIAAMTYISRLGTGSPLIGLDKEIDAIAAAVVGGVAMSGGRGNMFGVFIGVVLLAFISNALNLLGVSPFYQYLMKGIFIVGSVLISYYGSSRDTAVKSKG